MNEEEAKAEWEEITEDPLREAPKKFVENFYEKFGEPLEKLRGKGVSEACGDFLKLAGGVSGAETVFAGEPIIYPIGFLVGGLSIDYVSASFQKGSNTPQTGYRNLPLIGDYHQGLENLAGSMYNSLGINYNPDKE